MMSRIAGGLPIGRFSGKTAAARDPESRAVHLEDRGASFFMRHPPARRVLRAEG
jgi:hypothetical protein